MPLRTSVGPHAAEQRAQDAAFLLRGRFGSLLGVVLFGSVARGNAGPASDVDLLVIDSAGEVTRRELVDSIRSIDPDRRISVTLLTAASVSARVAAADAFLAHVVEEGRVLWERDRDVSSLLVRSAPQPPALLLAQLDAELAKLGSFEDLSQFHGLFRLCLAQLFVIGKAVAILRLLLDGIPVFSPDRVFLELRRAHPELAGAAASVSTLRPFWEAVRGRAHGAFPFTDRGAEAERSAAQAIAAIREIGQRG